MVLLARRWHGLKAVPYKPMCRGNRSPASAGTVFRWHGLKAGPYKPMCGAIAALQV
jgi:hypothetical protein